MKLSIIIVSWNTRALLAACLTSVYDCPPACDFEVWVVDNASSDGSAEMVERDFSQVQLIRNEKNLGFAGANNMAMQVSDGRYLLLLNPDTVVKPEALSALVQFMEENPQAGGAGSLLLNPDETLQFSCHPLPTLGRELWRLFHLDKLYPYGVYHMADWDTAVPHQAAIIQGASFILCREALVEVGLLDDSYFMYSEEVDLCYRLKEAGWPLYWVPQSRVIHYGGQSTKLVASDMFIELYRGKLHYFRKNYGPATAFGYKIILATATLPRLTLFGLAFLQKPPKRDEQISLAQNYGRLITTLPTM